MMQTSVFGPPTWVALGSSRYSIMFSPHLTSPKEPHHGKVAAWVTSTDSSTGETLVRSSLTQLFQFLCYLTFSVLRNTLLEFILRNDEVNRFLMLERRTENAIFCHLLTSGDNFSEYICEILVKKMNQEENSEKLPLRSAKELNYK